MAAGGVELTAPGLETGQWITLGLLVVLAFWMLGGYNRVVALRMAIVAAWAQVDGVLQARELAVTALLAAVAARLASEPVALDGVASAQAQLRAAAQATRPRPAAAEPIAALAAAETALAAPLARLVALVEHDDGLQADGSVTSQLQALRELAPRLQFARQLFNEAATAYNQAVHEFPTRWLAALFRFDSAGTL